jgi:hypothetical protein
MGLLGPNLCEWSTLQGVKASQSTRGVRGAMDKCNGLLRPCHHTESNELTMKAFALVDLVGDAALCNRERCATA